MVIRMDKIKKRWNRLRTISRFCVYIGIPAFFYFFGYRLTGTWSIHWDTLPYHNPFLYLNMISVLGGIFGIGLVYYVKKNKYKYDGKVLFRWIARILMVIFFVYAVRRWLGLE